MVIGYADSEYDISTVYEEYLLLFATTSEQFLKFRKSDVISLYRGPEALVQTRNVLNPHSASKRGALVNL